MPFMTVAENIWIRREPMNRFGFVDHRRACAARPPRCSSALNIDIDPEIEVARRCRVANRQMVEIAKAVSYEFRRPDHGRADLGADRDARSSTCSRSSATCAAQGKGIVYITHKMNELFEIADEFSVFRDGKYIGTHAATDVTRDDIIRMMVGREITQMFPKETVPIGDVVLSVEESRASRACSTTSRSSCAPARSSASPAWSARGAATSPRRSSA